MIPVLGTAIVNRPELLDKLLESLDEDCERIIVVDNGSIVDRWDVEVVRPGHNLGVAASWNLILKSAPLAPWWLITNHDIELGPGDLERLVSYVDEDQAAIYHLLGFAAFAMTGPALRKLGYFDENFHPAYDEDCDMSYRAELVGVPRIEVGFTGTHVGSATIYADASLRAQNGLTHPLNDLYYAQKWGGHKQGGETYTTPFNRGGHIGDWRLDPDRLRNQAWRHS